MSDSNNDLFEYLCPDCRQWHWSTVKTPDQFLSCGCRSGKPAFSRRPNPAPLGYRPTPAEVGCATARAARGTHESKEQRDATTLAHDANWQQPRYERAPGPYRAELYVIDEVRGYSITDADGHEIGFVEPGLLQVGGPASNHMGTALLFAAAPDLYTAALSAARAMSAATTSPAALDAAYRSLVAAIVKANGHDEDMLLIDPVTAENLHDSRDANLDPFENTDATDDDGRQFDE